MIKVIVIEDFHLAKFNELKNIERANPNKNENGMLYVNDTFECTKEMAEYLIEKNTIKKAVVKVIEVIPEEENKEKEKITHRRKRSVAKD